MIKHVKLVKLRTTGGYGFRITAEDSVMSENRMIHILKKHNGEDEGEYCWFDNYNDMCKAAEELLKQGAERDW